MTLPDLEQLLDKRGLLTSQIHDAVRKIFHVGSTVEWMLGSHRQSGTVLMASWERVKVKNRESRKEFWVNLYRIMDAHKKLKP